MSVAVTAKCPTSEPPEPTASTPADDEAVPSVRRGDGQTPPAADDAPNADDAPPAADDAPHADAAPPADDDLAVEGGGGALPVDSPFDLPPMVQLQVGRGAPATPALRRAVLRSGRLALSPAVRQGVEDGRANAAALELLLRLGRVERPLLVWRARGGGVRVQATSLAGTRDLVEHLHDATGIGLALRPVRGDFADEGRSLEDERMADIGSKAAQIALSQVGWPYSWGGGTANGPSTGTCNGYRGSIRPCPAQRTVGYDCSGLMLFAYAQVGIKLDHYAAFQWLEGRRVDSTQLVPGDLVFFHPKADGPGHVGMYVGDGKFVHAPHTGDVVKVSALADYASGYMGAVRPY